MNRLLFQNQLVKSRMFGKCNRMLRGERAKSESEREIGCGIGPQTNNELYLFAVARMLSESILHIPYMDVPCIGGPLYRVLYIGGPCIADPYIGGTLT